MAQYEVETDLLVHCRVKVMVEADSKEAAIDAASELLPSNGDGTSKNWQAVVTVRAPKGVSLRMGKAYHFEQASGADKARKVKQEWPA